MHKKFLVLSVVLVFLFWISQAKELETPSLKTVVSRVAIPTADFESSSMPKIVAVAIANDNEVAPSAGREPSAQGETTISHLGVFPSTYTDNEAYCRIKKAGLDIPLNVARIQTGAMAVVDGKGGGRSVQVQAEGCPEWTYSTVHFNLNHEVIDVTDCRQVTPQEIVLRDGLSFGPFFEVPSTAGVLNIAAHGGLFVSSCGGDLGTP